MEKPKLLMLYGFASSGKTTLAKKYIDEHPLAIAIEGDQIIGMIGQWRKNETEARKIVFEHTKALTKKHLQSGYDVLLPYLLTDSTQVDAFENIAKECEVRFLEVYIDIEKEGAINRLLDRGIWGEEGSPTLTKEDLPEITQLFGTMEDAMKDRSDVILVTSELGNIEETYSKFISAIG